MSYSPSTKTQPVAGTTTLVYNAGTSSYPARPVTAAAGTVIYIGPTTPPDWQTNDVWYKNV